MAFNGANFLVVWSRRQVDSFGNVAGKVYARRVSAAGTLVDAAQFYVMDGVTPDVAALGDTFLTVAIRPSGEYRTVESVRVSGAGVVLGPATIVLSNYNFAPRVAALGNQWLVVWEYHSRHVESTSWIRAAFVNSTGVVAPSVEVAMSDSPFGINVSYDDTPHLAVSGNEALIVWSDNDTNQNNIKGRRIQADGTLLGSNFGSVISDAPGGQFMPAVAWDGTQYLATWLDQRNELFPIQPRGDIYGARISQAGTVLDSTGFPVANSAFPEETPFVASANEATIFAYSAFYNQSPFSAMRVTTRRSSSSVTEGMIAVSRKVHGAMGSGDINLPLTGNLGVEPRTGGASGDHQIVVTFPAPVTLSQAQVTFGIGSVSSLSVIGSEVTINLTGVANAQTVTVTLFAVNNATDVALPMSVLLGDTNTDRVVNSGDVLQTRSRSGQAIDAANFRSDVNADGFVNSGDTTVVRSRSGTSLP